MPKTMSTASMCYLWDPSKMLLSRRVDLLTAEEECWYRRALDFSWIDDGLSADPVETADRIKKGCTPEAAAKLLEMFFEPDKKNPQIMRNDVQESKRKKLLSKMKNLSNAGKISGRNRRQTKRLDAEQMSDNCSTNGEQMSGNVIECNVTKDKKKNTTSTAARATDAEWLDQLKSKSAYKLLDIDLELDKAQTWAEANGRQCTRRFFVNWLNRAKPMETTNGNHQKTNTNGNKQTPGQLIANRPYRQTDPE